MPLHQSSCRRQENSGNEEKLPFDRGDPCPDSSNLRDAGTRDVNIPFLDDYSGVLGFVNTWFQLGTVHEKAMLIFTAQHNEYKLMFPNEHLCGRGELT